MESLVPFRNTFTIYSKSDCLNCKYVKLLLEDNEFKFIEVDCDKFLSANRDGFIERMKTLTDKEKIVFPIVFYNREYVGGFLETQKMITQMIDF